MAVEMLRAELERLFDLEEMLSLCRDVLGLDPDAVGGTQAEGSFAGALTEFCAQNDGLDALCDAIRVTKPSAREEVLQSGLASLASEDELLPGDHLGPYMIGRKLGDGPTGTSYIARGDEGEVRLKVLARDVARDERGLRRFLALTRLSARVRHLALPVRVRVGMLAGRAYVAHEAAVGETLSERVKRGGPMTFGDARSTLVHVLEALAALHAGRIVHGNVKLENIIAYQTPDGKPRAQLLDACGDRLRSRALANGQARAQGTGCPAPEVLRGQPLTPAADLYAFGAALFTLVTGKPVFDYRSHAEVLAAHLNEAVPSPSAVTTAGLIAPDLDAFVRSLLAKDPAERPKDAGAALEALDRIGRPASGLGRIGPTPEEVQARIDLLLLTPSDPELALAVESSVAEGADASAAAQALVLASDLLKPTENPDSKRPAIALLFRAGRLFQDAKEFESAERAYAQILALDPSQAPAQARIDDVWRKLGRHEDLIESLLDRAEKGSSGPERASAFAKIGSVYERDLGDPEQALVAATQAFTEDPSVEFAETVERLAGKNSRAWGEVLTTCNAASTEDRPPEIKNALFLRMASWYDRQYGRPDLALACFQAVLATEPSNGAALVGLSAVYRKTQAWPALANLLLSRADATTDPAAARELRFEAADILDMKLGDSQRAVDLYQEVLRTDPAHARAADALVRLLERSKNYGELVRLLSEQAEARRGEERQRALVKIAAIHEEHLKDDDEAIRRYSLVLDENPDHLEALRGLDRLYSKLGLFSELLENLERQRSLAPTPRQKMAIWERVAGIYDEEFLDHDKAAYALEQVTELDPEHLSSLRALTRHYRALSRWEDLTTIYERLYSFSTDPADRLQLALERARVLSTELSATERAIAAYDQALLLAPKHAEALEALARLRETAGQEDAALVAIDALAQKAETPDERAEQLVRAAKLLTGRGDGAGAIERLKRAAEAKPHDPQISKALRDAYVRHGDGNAAAQLLEREVENAGGDLQKAHLLAELARLSWEELQEGGRAESAARRALELDPTNTDALSVVGDICWSGKRFPEAATFYERLAARTEALAPELAVRALERYVDALGKAGSAEKALSSLDTLLRLAPDDPSALSRAATVTFDHGSAERAQELHEQLLARFGESLSNEERAAAQYRLGESARRNGAFDKAIEALETAADLEPANPLPLVSLASAHEARGDFVKVVDAKTRHLDLLHGQERVDMLVEIGEIAAGKLGDRALATKSLVAALDEHPDDRKLLTRLLTLYGEHKDWQKLIDVVLKLSESVVDPKQKAKYLQTAGTVAFREMVDYDAALGYYDKVLALDPENHNAADESIEVCEERDDWPEAVERLKRKAALASDARDNARMLQAFDRLATLYRDKLGRIGHAIDAHEAALTIEGENPERHKILSELYASDPSRYLEKAVAAQLTMLRKNPYRAESYKLLRNLYTETQHADPAWCLCQALYVLKLADAEEEGFFRRMRSEHPAYARSTLSEEDWASLLHESADPAITGLFALLLPAVAAARGQQLTELGYDPRLAVDAAEHPYPIAQTLHWAAGVMGLSLPPIFENWNDPGGLGFLPTEGPSLVLGTAALEAKASPQALAFIVGRQLTFTLPGFYVIQLLPTSTALRAWLFAAIRMNAPQFPVAADIEGPVREALNALETHLPVRSRDQLSRSVSKLIQSGAALDVKRWLQGVELTADRAGLLLAHDLETAVEIIRATDDAIAIVPSQPRLKELVLYAISSAYFELRRALGIGIDG